MTDQSNQFPPIKIRGVEVPVLSLVSSQKRRVSIVHNVCGAHLVHLVLGSVVSDFLIQRKLWC